MKKVLFFIKVIDQGGLETYLLRFLRFLNGEVKALVWCKSAKKGSLYDDYKEYTTDIILSKLGFFNVFDYIKLYLYLKKNKIDTVCDFSGNFSGLVMFVAYLAGVKTRLSFYRGSTNHFREDKFRLMYNSFMNKLVLNFSTKILSNSYAAFNFFFPNNSLQKEGFLKVIYNGIPSDFLQKSNEKSRIAIREELKLPINSFIVGHTGRYNEAKNHQTIINVAKILCDKYDNIYFVLVGKDTDLKLKGVIEDYGLQNRVLLLGYRRDIPNILSSFDLFFFPSLTEGQPNSLLEAMILGLPIVASDIEPIKESVPEYFTSKLLPPLDINAFAEKIEYIYMNPNSVSEYILSDWALQKYSSDKLFNEFKDEILL